MQLAAPPKHFRFVDYNASELDACGRAICSDLVAKYQDIDSMERATAAWTGEILDWFKASAAANLVAYHRSAHGEFLLDLIHATWLPSDTWQVAVEKPCKVKLAVECEWGKRGSRPGTVEEVLKDATKVAIVRADVKVVVFGSCDENHRAMLISLLVKLRTNSRDEAPWLWVDAPWWVDESVGWKPEYGVIGDRRHLRFKRSPRWPPETCRYLRNPRSPELWSGARQMMLNE